MEIAEYKNHIPVTSIYKVTSIFLSLRQTSITYT